MGAYNPKLDSPFLTYTPIDFSLTDGTSIPPPAPDLPRKSGPSIPCAKNHPTVMGGPLSSHPVTPIESNVSEMFFEKSMHHTRSKNSVNARSYLSGMSSESTEYDPTRPQHSIADVERRPSLVARIMRLRSSSVLKSKSSLGKYADSAYGSHSRPQTPSLSTSPENPTILSSERGIKRPASPSTPLNSSPGSNTFPRMVRKKSRDLLTTARRKSGFWGKDEDDVLNDMQGGQKRYSPPPSVHLSSLGGEELDGDTMFKDIGS